VRTNLLPFLVAPGLLLAQLPRVGLVEIYGLHKVSAKSVQAALGVQPGDPLPASKAPIEDRLSKLPGVARASLEAFCCDGDKAVLYVGIEAREAHHFETRPVPTQEIALSPYIANAYHQFLDAGADTARTEDRLRELATTEFADLKNALHNAVDPAERATATAVIRYAPDQRVAIAELQFAMQDSDEVVRANAMRGLDAFIASSAASSSRGRKGVDAGPPLAGANGAQSAGVTVQPTWFIEMLNSIVWSERTHAANTLLELTAKRDPATLDQIRQRGVESLAEMANWHIAAHAKPAFVLLGRIAGLRDDEIERQWASGERKKTIERALKVKRVAGAPETISVPYWKTPEMRP